MKPKTQLDNIWKENPASIIDWIRDNRQQIENYLFELHQMLRDCIQIINDEELDKT